MITRYFYIAWQRWPDDQSLIVIMRLYRLSVVVLFGERVKVFVNWLNRAAIGRRRPLLEIDGERIEYARFEIDDNGERAIVNIKRRKPRGVIQGTFRHCQWQRLENGRGLWRISERIA